MNNAGVSPKVTTRGCLGFLCGGFSIGIGLIIGIFGVYLGVIGVMSAGQYGTYGMSDQVAQLMSWSLLVVAPVVLGGLALGVAAMIIDRKRQATLGRALAVIGIVCNLGGGLVYLLGWFVFGFGSQFHY